MRKAFLYKAAAFSCTAVVLVLSVLPDLHPSPDIGNIDKAYHFLAYLVLGWLWAGAFLNAPSFKAKGAPTAFAAAFAVSFMFGAAVEIIQSYIPYRDAEALDHLANGAGALAGALIQMYAYKLKGRHGHETR